VPGIDAILVGHAHKEIVERWVTNEATGEQVLLTEPLKWGMRLSVIDLDLTLVEKKWRLRGVSAQVLNSNTVDEDPAVVDALQKQHDIVVDYVNSVIGTSAQAMSASRAVVEDVAAIDFVNYVQADAVKQALAGTADAALPVVSIAAVQPRRRDPGGRGHRPRWRGCIPDNTLLAVKVTARRSGTTWSSRRLPQQVSGTGPFAMMTSPRGHRLGAERHA
jgi:2',3'-cyclic-nucleotide 2'-phosphodiesterase/3'-nucleotidase